MGKTYKKSRNYFDDDYSDHFDRQRKKSEEFIKRRQNKMKKAHKYDLATSGKNDATEDNDW